ncbi:MAG: DUF6351 family protein [Bryobacterales bacterium]|nr:DUF6351 family protein [Bryobacterales bacterium]MEB2361728.1 DUF6351 family protein [Bryobacterales bacterium]
MFVRFAFRLAVFGFLAFAADLPSRAAEAFRIVTLSNQPDRISGGDVLVRIEVPEAASRAGFTVKLNGRDITTAFHRRSTPLVFIGLVTGLRKGQNTLEVFSGGESPSAMLSLTNFDRAGPVFSGRHQQPFICETENFKLPDGSLLGPPIDENCSIETVVTYVYKPDGGSAPVKPLSSRSVLPADVAWTTTTSGLRVPYIVRVETGTINRAIYQTAILHDPTTEPEPGPLAPPKAWNGRLLYSFGGGCTGGWYRQGGRLHSLISDQIAGKGYAEASSTLNVFGMNCQDVTAAETMMMVKERFIEAYGRPLFTFGRGGSGGSYQQLQIADGYPGLLDGIIPSATFPEVLETTQFLVDAQLLDNYFNNAGQSLTEEQRMAISGAGTMKNITATASGAGRIHPSKFCPEVLPPELRYDPVLNRAGARCDIFDHTVNVYGRDPVTGFARRVIDNVGVQYGLGALNKGIITPAQFLDLNEKIGGYDNDGNIVATRAVADLQAVRAAYQTGRITNGGGGLASLPIIDYRVYMDLGDRGDVHLKYHSFALRERLRAANGTTANEVMLVVPPGTGSRAVHDYAITKMDEWLTNLINDTSNDPAMDKIVRAKPQDLVDSCYTATGERIVETQTFSGGKCNKLYPAFASPRMVAGGPITNNVLKCQLKPVDAASYSVAFTEMEQERLRSVFPDGVCDWSKPGMEQQKPLGTWLRY